MSDSVAIVTGASSGIGEAPRGFADTAAGMAAFLTADTDGMASPPSVVADAVARAVSARQQRLASRVHSG